MDNNAGPPFSSLSSAGRTRWQQRFQTSLGTSPINSTEIFPISAPAQSAMGASPIFPPHLYDAAPMNNPRRSHRAHVPSRRLLESGNAYIGIAIIEGNDNVPQALPPSGVTADDAIVIDDELNGINDNSDETVRDNNQSMMDNQTTFMDVDTASPSNTMSKVELKKASSVVKSAKFQERKRQRAIQKAKFDQKRLEERAQAKAEGISFWHFQERQREADRRKNVIRLQQETKAAVILGGGGVSIFNFPVRARAQTVAFPGMVPTEQPKTTKIKKENSSEREKGPGRMHKQENNGKKHGQKHAHEKYYNQDHKISKAQTKRYSEKHNKHRLDAIVKSNMGKTLAMFETLTIGKAMNITTRGQQVPNDIGIWNIFGGQPQWYVPLLEVDKNVVNLFPIGEKLPTRETYTNRLPLRDLKSHKTFARGLDMTCREFKKFLNGPRGPKPNAIKRSHIKELGCFEQSVKRGGNREPFTSQIQCVKENQYAIELKVEAIRKLKFMKVQQEAPHSLRRPVSSVKEEGRRIQPLLRIRGFRNIVKIAELREEKGNMMELDDNKENTAPSSTSNPFKKRVIHPKGFQVKPIRLHNGALTKKQVATMKAEKKALQGDARPSPPPSAKPSLVTPSGDVIRCICGGLENDDEYDGLWISCNDCDVWQHNVCVGAPMDQEIAETVDYYCEECKPENHEEYLEALERGEEIWERRIQTFEDEQAAIKMRKQAKGRKGLRKLIERMNVEN